MFGKIFDNSNSKIKPMIESARRTTDDVMRAFHKTLDDLKKVKDEHAAEAARQREISASAFDKAIAAESEAKRAEQVAEKLAVLIAA